MHLNNSLMKRRPHDD